MIPDYVPAKKRASWLTQNHDKFCLLPWLNINTNPDGKVKLCCNIQLDDFVKDAKEPFNLGHHDIELIWNSEYMKNVRSAHLNNTGSSDCKDCYKLEKFSNQSSRTGQNTSWLQRSEFDPGLEEFLEKNPGQCKNEFKELPISLELRLGNFCNLLCLSCWGISSSAIHEERQKILFSNELDAPELAWLKKRWTIDYRVVGRTELKDWYETDMFFSNVKKMAPLLRRLNITGGEPTLIKSNYKIFQILLDAHNDWCTVEFTTNMTTFNSDFYKRLEKFSNVEIQMSIDGIGEIGEYLRYPTKFDKIRENFDQVLKMAASKPGWRIKCFTVVQALNYQNIIPIWKFLFDISEKYQKQIIWWPIVLSYPPHLSLASVSLEDRQRFISKLNAERNEYMDQSKKFHISQIAWDAYSGPILQTEHNPEYKRQLLTYVNLVDRQRGLSGKNLFSEVLK